MRSDGFDTLSISCGRTSMIQRERNPTNVQRLGSEKSLPIARAGSPGKAAFDYQDLPEENRGEVRELVGRIRRNKGQLFISAVAIGRDLARGEGLGRSSGFPQQEQHLCRVYRRLLRRRAARRS